MAEWLYYSTEWIETWAYTYIVYSVCIINVYICAKPLRPQTNYNSCCSSINDISARARVRARPHEPREWRMSGMSASARSCVYECTICMRSIRTYACGCILVQTLARSYTAYIHGMMCCLFRINTGSFTCMSSAESISARALASAYVESANGRVSNLRGKEWWMAGWHGGAAAQQQQWWLYAITSSKLIATCTRSQLTTMVIARWLWWPRATRLALLELCWWVFFVEKCETYACTIGAIQ